MCPDCGGKLEHEVGVICCSECEWHQTIHDGG